MNRREYSERNAYSPTGKHYISSNAGHLSPSLCTEDKHIPGADNPKSVCPSSREILPLWIKLTLLGRDAKLNRGEFRYFLKLQHFFEHQATILVALAPPLVVVIMVSLTWLITLYQQAAHLLTARIMARG
jgi:hypothetical protein